MIKTSVLHGTPAWAAIILLWWPTITWTAVNGDYWRLPLVEPVTAGAMGGEDGPHTSLRSEDCGLCHAEQFDQWRESFHGKAVSPGLLGQFEAFDAGTRDMCLDCHAPRDAQREAIAELGLDALGSVDGVDCAACHVRADGRFGPRSVAATPHGPVMEEPLFRSADFCAPCHQFTAEDVAVNGKPLENTHEEWRDSNYARDGITCQSCHMAEGSHRFGGIHDPDVLRQGLGLAVTRTERGVTVTLSNRAAGHALPTYVTPLIRVVIEGTTGASRSEHIIQRRMSWSREQGWGEVFDTRLRPHESRRLELPLDAAEGARAQVIVEPDADYHDRVYPFLMEHLAQDLGAESMAALETARAAAGASIYTAYDVSCGPWQGEPVSCAEP
ncbi:MAG: multiheme c-type cytochrome [Gammaproteobacteria bacterium]|nr:multiheme c-type cytochrome [Gammaproteobacteria bacterium]